MVGFYLVSVLVMFIVFIAVIKKLKKDYNEKLEHGFEMRRSIVHEKWELEKKVSALQDTLTEANRLINEKDKQIEDLLGAAFVFLRRDGVVFGELEGRLVVWSIRENAEEEDNDWRSRTPLMSAFVDRARQLDKEYVEKELPLEQVKTTITVEKAKKKK